MKRILTSLILTFWVVFALPAQEIPDQTDAPVRIGIVGLTHDHVHWLLGRKNRGDLEIVGIVEPDASVVERYRAQYQLDPKLFFPSIKKMIKKADPQGICIFTPTHQHLEVVAECAPYKVHLMVEKPLATNLEEARQMAALAAQHKVHLLTHYETTHFPSINKAYHIVNRQRQVGDLTRMIVMAGHPGPEKIGVSDAFMSWLGDSLQQGGGALMDFGCYGINLMTWFAEGQRPLSVTAVTQRLQPDLYPEVEDEATLLLTYPQGICIVQASWNWPDNRKVLELYGTEGYVHCLDEASMRIVKSNHPNDTRVPAPKSRPPMDEGYGFFAAVVKGAINPGQWFPASIDNNLLVMEILDLARASAQSGKTMVLEK